MFARLAIVPSVDRRPVVPAPTVLAVAEHRSVRPYRGRAPLDRPVLQCRWRIAPDGKLAAVWSVAGQARGLWAEPTSASHIGSPPLQPTAAGVVASAFMTAGMDHGRDI